MITRTAGISICIVRLGIAVFLLFYARPLLFLAQTKREFRNSPGIWIVSKPLAPRSDCQPYLQELQLSLTSDTNSSHLHQK
jgi:hypothetical protein